MSKSIYERVLNLRNRISLDGDDTIYEEDYLLLDEVLDFIGSVEQDNEIKAQIHDYNNTVDIYRELEIGIKFKKQEKLLELYKELSNIYEKLNSMDLSLLSLNSNYYAIEIIKLKQQIKELEK